MKLRRANNRKRAWTLKEVLVVIFAVAVLVTLVLPGLYSVYYRSRGNSRYNCLSNLKQVGLAFRIWEVDNNDHYPMKGFTNKLGIAELPNSLDVFRYFQVMSNELNTPRILTCRSDNRIEATNFDVLSNTNLSYFVGLDADESYPSMPLAGDRNLVVDGVAIGPGLLTLSPTNEVGWSAKMHNNAGNIGLVDGSVQQVTAHGLQQAILHSGTNVNRLAVP